MTRVLAAADIGSNTAHLLVAATDGQLVMRIDNTNEWIPLGEVVTRQGVIPKEIIQQLILALKEFRRVAAGKEAESLYVFATEGMRMARNHDQVLRRMEDEAGVRVELISPEREAELSLRGVMLDTRHLGADVMFEVGGGSAQIARLARDRVGQDISLPLGTGRIIAEAGLQNPCPEYAMVAAVNYIDDVLSRVPRSDDSRLAVASGGVGRGLWRALHPDGEKLLRLPEIDYLIDSVSRLPVDRITARFGVKTKRAGTLLPGALVYRALLRRFGLTEMVVSEYGIREGAILEMAAGRLAGGRL